MSHPIPFRPEAQTETAEAASWYEARRPGFGDRFLQAVGDCLDSIRRHPQMYTELEPGIRRAVLTGFPYSVIYATEPEGLLVIAVFHASRDPQDWRDRL